MKTPERAINAQKLQGVIIQLRKVCNHPYLFNIGEEELPYSFAEGQLAAKYNKKTPEIVQWSGKMLLLERLLPALFERGHKVLIFSQMTRALDIISDWCDLVKGWSFCRIDGNIRIDERRSQVIVAQFN